MKPESIVFVQFSKEGRPHLVVAQQDGRYTDYDFDFSKELGGLLYHESGNGPVVPLRPHPGRRYWAATGVQLVEVEGAERTSELPIEYALGRLFVGASDCPGGIVYCSVCRDHFPDDEACGHIWWCDECDELSTPDERCECEANQD